MKRRKARHKMMELSRRLYLKEHGTLKGFGRIARFYNRNWRPDASNTMSYKDIWNHDLMVDLRSLYDMN